MKSRVCARKRRSPTAPSRSAEFFSSFPCRWNCRGEPHNTTILETGPPCELACDCFSGGSNLHRSRGLVISRSQKKEQGGREERRRQRRCVPRLHLPSTTKTMSFLCPQLSIVSDSSNIRQYVVGSYLSSYVGSHALPKARRTASGPPCSSLEAVYLGCLPMHEILPFRLLNLTY